MIRSPLLPLTIAAAALAAIGLAAWLITGTPGAVLQNEPSIPELATPSDSDVVSIEVAPGEGAGDIAKRLEEAGVIRSARLFRILVSLMGVEDEMVAGNYEFDRDMPTLQVIGRLQRGITMPLMVTVPEGLRSEEVAQLMERQGIVSADDFRRALASGEYDFGFLAERPPGAGLEGYLFPATYGFSRGVTAEEVVRRMLTAFDEQVTPELRQAAQAAGLTLHEAVTLASIVEREAVKPEERPLIASVFLNRLRLGMPLEADPTVQYALANDPGNVERFGFWKQGLTVEDLGVDSPYNTYVNGGLPPGPICNPGLASLEAVAHPAQTNYLYFVAREDGSHVFAETLEEHLRNVEEYQR
jgi:UPF0755 protein